MLKDRKSIFLIICLLIVFVYTYIFYLVYSRAEQQHFNAFEVVTGLSGLVISILTIYYVYNTYDVQMKQMELQREQMDIQRNELEENRAELEKNRRDAEFNRTVDLTYKQITLVNERVSLLKYDSLLKKFSEIRDGETFQTLLILLDNRRQTEGFAKMFWNDCKIYLDIIFNNILDIDQRDLLRNIVTNNTHWDMFDVNFYIYDTLKEIFDENGKRLHRTEFEAVIHSYVRQYNETHHKPESFRFTPLENEDVIYQLKRIYRNSLNVTTFLEKGYEYLAQ